MIGNKVGVDFTFPEKHNSIITVKDAIKDLPKLNNGDSLELLNYRKVKINPYIELMRGKSLKAPLKILFLKTKSML